MFFFLAPSRFSLFVLSLLLSLFFFNDTATTEIYTLSLHDALPISYLWRRRRFDHELDDELQFHIESRADELEHSGMSRRSEEHTSELQSHVNLVCRLLLEKKKKKQKNEEQKIIELTMTTSPVDRNS